MITVAYLVFLGIGVALSVVENQHLLQHDDLWKHWKDQHGKVYKNNQEADLRRGHWEKNVAMIQEHNIRHQLGLKTYTMGLNHLSDLTWDEVRQIYLSGVIRPKAEVDEDLPVRWVTAKDAEGAPQNIDWREHDIVSPVKDQGWCGSGYTFSATGAIESQYMKQKQSMQLFSQQQLVDCSRTFGNYGCGGGWQINCYRYINKYGLEGESDYPYSGSEGQCAYNPQLATLNVTEMARSTLSDEVAMLALVGRYGPTAVIIDSTEGFAYYKSGIYISDDCSQQVLNHAVLAVGYGTEGGQDYWIVKNSWGDRWGDKGYIKMARNYNNMCGIAVLPSVPLIKI